jgi:hypothetical protein
MTQSDFQPSRVNSEHTPFATSLIAGIAQRKINPPIGIRTANWGLAKINVATGIHNSITATAMAVKDGDEKFQFLVSVDWGWWQGEKDDIAIRGKVINALGIEEDQLQLHLTHTHAGPSTASDVAHLEGGELVPAYHTFATNQIIEACKEALAQSCSVIITWSYGRCDLATNRDLPCGETDIVGFNPEEPADDTLTIGRICDLTGKIMGTIVNYACHPTTLAWMNSKISPDFVGESRDIIQSKTGAPMLFLQGASGDLAPRDDYSGDTEVADKNGRILGYAALATLEKMVTSGKKMRFLRAVNSACTLGEWEEVHSDAPTITKAVRLDIEVPLRHLPTIEDLRIQWQDIDKHALETRIYRAMKLRAGYVLQDGRANHPVWIWQWGDAIIVGQPGEAYSYFQMELRRRHPDRVILVLNCTNGPGYMYLPTPAAYKRRRYQAWQTLLCEGALELITDKVSDAISKFPKTQG